MKTEIIMITDRSGSMSIIRDDAQGGFNAFIEDQKKVSGEARVTSVVFDDAIETQYQARPLADVPGFELSPRGSTALYDALGRTLSEQAKRIADEAWADLVIAVIITDGQENASREYTQDQVKSMVSHAESKGWKFIYLAANQDAAMAARAVGVVHGQAVNYSATAKGVADVYGSMSAATTSLRSGGSV